MEAQRQSLPNSNIPTIAFGLEGWGDVIPIPLHDRPARQKRIVLGTLLVFDRQDSETRILLQLQFTIPHNVTYPSVRIKRLRSGTKPIWVR
ncbi:hypothetical protein PoB_001265400 [Plakobranchus ocellatus]|uniref:Uncharacterized protein n=1 Tax=Plakobranchus ocellatus TaxID=259542 RepID=A0AAV3YVR7_9GAST|nr:hypothetical protein PoB_001265400 [Plakobranchus ocellatus]